MKSGIRLALAACVALLLGLSGCGGGGGGGGGGGSAQTSPAQGFWTGTTSNGYGLMGAVLENGEYWFMYYAGNAIEGLVQGTGSASNGNFVSTDGLDFWAGGGAVAVNVSGSYRERETLQGFVTPRAGGAPVSFTTTYDRRYDQPASAAAITGTWRGVLASGETFRIDVAANGALSGASALGCTYSGNAVPRASGKNVYDVTIAFNGGVCALGTQTVRGIGAVIGSGAGAVLYAAALNAARSAGFVVAAGR